jgi:hypothetical protein
LDDPNTSKEELVDDRRPFEFDEHLEKILEDIEERRRTRDALKDGLGIEAYPRLVKLRAKQ